MQVFISHSSHNKDFAARLANDLMLYDIVVWFDEWCIRPGDSIPGAIQAGLLGSDFVLLVLSRKAIESNWVNEELNSTLYSTLSSERPKLVPLVQERCSLPPLLQHRKYLDFSRDEHYEDALSDLVAFLYQGYSDTPPPQPAIHGFREVRLLGEGGFSTVYKAVEVKTSAVKAIKIPKGRHRLEPEIAVAKRLDGHAGIVPIERSISFKDRIVLVMPYAGHSLKWHLEHRKIKPQQLEQIVVWMKNLLEVLIFAHSKNIIHRDIKPSNILIDEFGDLRVVDFGIAQKIQYVEFQQSTIVRGTLCYMSPEQQLAERVTQQSDIYSFGAVFYELVTGEKPVGRFRSPRFYNNQIPVLLEEVIEKCLERDLGDRYKTAGDVLQDLSRSLVERAYVPVETDIIGDSPEIKSVIEYARRIAQSSSSVLITGESGTGKELVARLIYREYEKARRKNGSASSGPFVSLNMAALTEFLAEAELFGHEKGAFTGAVMAKRGKLEVADGGVILLDDIDQASLEVQAKLLNVLATGEFTRVGGTRLLHVDVKVITATNRSLEKLVEERRFRQDLYYRLNVFPIFVPPLRARKGDILLLIEHFVNKYSKRLRLERPKRISKEAMDALINYDWPGNVRELENAIERVLILSSTDVVQLEDLPEAVLGIESPLSVRALDFDQAVTLKQAREKAERLAIQAALKSSGGNHPKAAKILQITLTSLQRLMKKYDLT